MNIIIHNKQQEKFALSKQQFGCGYYLVCCRDVCPCSLKFKGYDEETMEQMKQEFEIASEELFSDD